MAIIIISLVIGIVALWGIATYNSLIKMRNEVDEGWSGIDVQLKRRYDLIPNLIEIVKGYQAHESNVFKEVTELRSQAMATSSVKDKAQAESALGLGLGRLFAIAEQYPELKASQNFLDLSQNLSAIEDDLQLARRYYNGTVRQYNTGIQSFPNSILANYFSFIQRDFFEIAEAAERMVPKVEF
jgi:LemA protein